MPDTAVIGVWRAPVDVTNRMCVPLTRGDNAHEEVVSVDPYFYGVMLSVMHA